MRKVYLPQSSAKQKGTFEVATTSGNYRNEGVAPAKILFAPTMAEVCIHLSFPSVVVGKGSSYAQSRELNKTAKVIQAVPLFSFPPPY